MEVQEFGKQNSRKIMLLPGNMMSWRQSVSYTHLTLPTKLEV